MLLLLPIYDAFEQSKLAYLYYRLIISDVVLCSYTQLLLGPLVHASFDRVCLYIS